MNNKIKWIMFDLGNVLVEYKPTAHLMIARKLNIDEELVKSFIMTKEIWDKTGKGEIGEEQYLNMINKKFNASITMNELLEFYAKEVETILDGIEEIIINLKKNYKLSILSNTFFAHWNQFVTTDLIKHFDIPMTSYLLGAIKPDEEIYLKALSKMKSKPEEVLFIDDKEENVLAANKLGINAFKSLSIEDTINGLRKFKVY